METLYLKDLSSCLIESLTQLSETRPRDPIEYLALSLKRYRRLHPLNFQGRQQHGVKALRLKANVVSPSDTLLSDNEAVTSTSKITLEMDFDYHIERAEKDLRLLDKYDIFVHKDFIQQAELGDLFDDDDLL